MADGGEERPKEERGRDKESEKNHTKKILGAKPFPTLDVADPDQEKTAQAKGF